MNEVFCFIDTETTGWKKNGALVQEGQARVCQLALLLTDHEGFPLAKFSSLIKPDGWTISKGAFECHGITVEQCEQFGVSFQTAVGMYKWISSRATLRVAHNADFDGGLLDIECAYDLKTRGLADIKTNLPPWFCTMKDEQIRKQVNAKDKNGNLKDPKLEEALQYFCGRSVGENAHDALVDAEACKDVFFAARKKAAA